MHNVIPGLYASEPESLGRLGSGASLQIRAFLLRREGGNLLVYRSASLEQDVEAVRDLGGVWRQYLNHRHEASPACDWVAGTFGAPLHVHREDAGAASEVCGVAATFSGRHRVGEDFEVIPIPGHTDGATAFLWSTGEHRVLFPGDTIFFGEGGVGDRRKYVQSLELLRSLDFDLVVPGITVEGEPYHWFVEKTEAERRIDGLIEQVRRGGGG